MIGLRNCALTAAAVFACVLPSAQCQTEPASVPIAIGGKETAITLDFIALMLPEYDVVHAIHSTPVGMLEFPPLLMGQITIPASGLGSNFNNPDPRIPKAIFIGGGFSQYEIDAMYNNTAVQGVPWLYPPTASRENGTIVPPTEVIVATVKGVFAAHGFVPGNVSNVQPGVWSFGAPP